MLITGNAMKLWGKKTETPSAFAGTECAAGRAGTVDEWTKEVVQALASEAGVDRIGLWMESPGTLADAVPHTLMGAVWDREQPDTPAEWRHLSPEAALPADMIRKPRPIEQDFENSSERTFFGPLVGMRRALWVPLEASPRLRGVLLVGSRSKNVALPRARAEFVSSRVALALQAAEQKTLADQRFADLELLRQSLERMNTAMSIDSLQANVLHSCTEAASRGGLGAAFAALGVCSRNSHAEDAAPAFLWQSGDPAALRGLNSQPVAGVWQKALREVMVAGSETRLPWDRSAATRVIAVPVRIGAETAAVLVIGLPVAQASLAVLERVEFRATLAATLLERERRTKREAEQSERQRTLLESASEAAILLESDGAIAGLTAGAKQLLGASASPGVFFPALFSGIEQRKVQSWLENKKDAARAGTPIEADLHGSAVRLHWIPSGGVFPAVFLEHVPRAASSATAGDERAESELKHVLEWLEEGVVLFDAANNVRAINSRFEQMAGFSPEESGKHRTLDSLIERLGEQAAEPSNFAERWRELAAGLEGGVREELQMVRPMPRVLERAARPVLDPVGRLLGRVEIYRDLTAQRIFQSKLLQTEKLAALGQMMTGVAHELSNPLTTILGYAQRLMMRNDAAGRSEEARHILEEAERAGRILRQVLANARETPPERRSIGLNQLVQRALELQRFGLAAAKIRVELDLDPLLPNVQGDSGQLQQVLMNLIGNARQALEENGKGGAIRIATRQIAENRVALDIEDDGPGIPPSVLPRIFDPFFTTKPAGEGTGLGLAIVLNIVREHGGQVQVAAPSGGGAAFHIELPARAAQPFARDAETRRAKRVETPAAAASGSLHETEAHKSVGAAATYGSGAASRRVLVVEDEPTVARLISDVLHDDGFQVEVLLDGRAALERARESFDLVICDMKMPGLDGQHFYKSLVRMASPLRDRFLFVTGDAIGPQTRAFLQQNALAYLSKPFRVEELTEKVRAILAVQSSGKDRAPIIARKNAARNG